MLKVRRDWKSLTGAAQDNWYEDTRVLQENTTAVLLVKLSVAYRVGWKGDDASRSVTWEAEDLTEAKW